MSMNCYANGIENEIFIILRKDANYEKLAVLSLVLMLAVGVFVTGCKKKVDVSEKEQKSEVKAPAEKASEAKASAEKTEKTPAEEADKPFAARLGWDVVEDKTQNIEGKMKMATDRFLLDKSVFIATSAQELCSFAEKHTVILPETLFYECYTSPELSDRKLFQTTASIA